MNFHQCAAYIATALKKIVLMGLCITAMGCRPSHPSHVRTSNGLLKWQVTTLACSDGQPVMSPDGQFIAYVTTQTGDPHIWVYDIEEETPSPLTANEGRDEHPCFSKDGEWLVFSSTMDNQSDLWMISREGQLLRLTNTPARDERFPIFIDGDSMICYAFRDSETWGLGTFPRNQPSNVRTIHEDSMEIGKITAHAGDVLFQRRTGLQWDIVERTRGGDVRTILSTPDDEMDPCLSSDGKWLAYTHRSSDSMFSQIYLFERSSRREIAMEPNAADQRHASWSADGHSILYEAVTPWTIKFIDVETQEDTVVVLGEHPVIDPVFGADGSTITYAEVRPDRSVLKRLHWRSGRTEDIGTGIVSATQPDCFEQELVFTGRDSIGRTNIYRMRGDANAEPLTTDGVSLCPRYSRDGNFIFFTRRRGQTMDVWSWNRNTKQVSQLTIDEKNESWATPHGSADFLLFAADWAGRWSIWQMPTSGGMPLPVTRDKTPYAWDQDADISPNGERMIFTRSWYDDADIWMMKMAGGEKTTRTLTKDNTQQEMHGRWSPDGRTVVFQAGGNRDVWSIDVEFLVRQNP